MGCLLAKPEAWWICLAALFFLLLIGFEEVHEQSILCARFSAACLELHLRPHPRAGWPSVVVELHVARAESCY